MPQDPGRREKGHEDSRQVMYVLPLASLVAVVLGYVNHRFWSAASVVLILLVLIVAMWTLMKLN
jgi:hypothetical protein